MNAVFAERGPLWITAIGLLAFNMLVVAACLGLKPRSWTRVLCAITGHVATVFVLLGVACGKSGLLDDLKGELDLAPYAALFLVLLAQLAILRIISWYRMQDHSAIWWPG